MVKKPYSNWYLSDWDNLSVSLKVIFTVYLNPIFSATVIIINVISIIALAGKSIKKELEKQYSYLIIYTISTLLYIITIPMSLINSSSTTGSIWSRYFALFFTVLIPNILKTFSSLTYLMFILERYIKISSTKNNILKLF